MIDPGRLRALELSRDREATPANLARVARESGEANARWAFLQWDLRRRARFKFSRADEMLFVREALEQATHERVAAYHASRFPPGVLVADLTAGIGADLQAIAQRGPAFGFEIDSERAALAKWNAVAEVRVEDSLMADWLFDYAFADPARRTEGRRTLDPNEFAPNPSDLAARMATLQLGGLKLSPLLPDSFLESLGPCLEFVSFGGECREALVWVGAEATAGRWAIHVESGERIAAGDAPPPVELPGEYFYEADPASIRTHALGTLCERHRLSALGDSNGYLTGQRVESPWLKRYRVLEHGKADVKATRKLLHALHAKVTDLKQRAAGQDMAKLRKELASEGDRPVLVAVWPVGKSLRHTILEPS